MNSGKEVNLTDSENNDDVEAVWSPDGVKIAFTSGSHSDDREASLSWGVYMMDPDGSDMVKLGDNLSQPTWLPDSKRLLAVRRDAERAYSLVIVDSQDRRLQTVLECAEEPEYQFVVAYYPVWLP